MADASSSSIAPPRLGSLDVYRGFVMLLMAAEMLHLHRLAQKFPDSTVWQWIGFNTNHVAWTGCSLHDLIQPSFSFLVGVALPFSLASRRAKGQSTGVMWLHALWRSLLLVLLGVFLRSVGKPMTYWTFEDTLSQIGLGYPFLFALGFAGPKTRWTTLGVVLVGYWLAWACFRLPPPDFDYSLVKVTDTAVYCFPDFAAHWNMNSNAGWAFDMWFLNLFPRQHPFVGNAGGYLTLSFIPTLGTMLLGLIAGTWIQNARAAAEIPPAEAVEGAARRTQNPQAELLVKLLAAGLACMVLALLCQRSGICPVVKKIWTPSWTLYSARWCFLFLAAFYIVVDLLKWKAWAFPLKVIGMNSIAIYVMVHLTERFFQETLETHLSVLLEWKWVRAGLAVLTGTSPAALGENASQIFGPDYAATLEGAVVLLILWLILWWMYRRKLFLKI